MAPRDSDRVTRQRFGHIRRLPSGRYQASFLGPTGKRQSAPATFRTESEARRWLSVVKADLRSGRWQQENLGRRTLAEYCEIYLQENPKIGLRWAETCRRNMRLHLAPLLARPVASITPADVRSWHAQALRRGGRTSVAQSYRFLRSVLNMAVDDEAIDKNPCKVPGAGTTPVKERTIATPAQVAALIQATTPRYQAAVALAAWCGLRRGEICALRVGDVDLDAGTVKVTRTLSELLESSRKVEKPPKSQAGVRTVAIPPHILPLIAQHMQRWAGPDYVFVGSNGSPITGNTLYQAFVRARERVGVAISFHDLRHTGQSLAAAAGANLADLKRRLGHSSSAAAIRYLHSVEGRDSAIATALSALAAKEDPAALPRPLNGKD